MLSIWGGKIGKKCATTTVPVNKIVNELRLDGDSIGVMMNAPNAPTTIVRNHIIFHHLHALPRTLCVASEAIACLVFDAVVDDGISANPIIVAIHIARANRPTVNACFAVVGNRVVFDPWRRGREAAVGKGQHTDGSVVGNEVVTNGDVVVLSNGGAIP